MTLVSDERLSDMTVEERLGQFLKAPILLIVWRRPDLTRQLLARVIQSGPRRIYVSADGPRPDSLEDELQCSETRKVVEEYSKLGTIEMRFVSKNHGARGAILSAMEWFFDNESEGIVLEDDSYPEQEFFTFCDEMLARFRQDERVFQVSGTNYLKGRVKFREPYYFSRHHHIWGFATWKRSWDKFVDLSQLETVSQLKLAKKLPLESKRFCRIWEKRVLRELSGDDDNWDSSWNLAGKSVGQFAVTSSRVLVTNIGFDDRALHTSRIPLVAGRAPAAEKGTYFVKPEDDYGLKNKVIDSYTERVQWKMQPLLLLWMLGGLELVRRLFWKLLTGKKIVEGEAYLTVSELVWFPSRLLRRIEAQSGTRLR